MKTWKLLSVLGLAAGLAGGAQGAVLQTHAGGSTGAFANITIIDTSSDTGDWIDGFGDDDDATLFYGFDFTITDNAGETGGGGHFAGLQLQEGGGEHIGVGNNWNSINISTFAHGPDNDLTGTPYVVGTTYRLVVQIDYNSAGDDTATVWIDPVSAASASTVVGGADASFDAVLLRAGSGSATFGNVIFATTFDEAAAIPEPGSLALLGLGGLAMLRRRRG